MKSLTTRLRRLEAAAVEREPAKAAIAAFFRLARSWEVASTALAVSRPRPRMGLPQALSMMAWRMAGRCHNWRRERLALQAEDAAPAIGAFRLAGRSCSSAQASSARAAIAT